jgi:hypothetical protein
MSIQQVALLGDPDKLLCIRGRFVAMELKAEKGGSGRKLQRWKLIQIQKAGGIAMVVSPTNWELAKWLLLKLDEGIYDQDVVQAIEQLRVHESYAETD